MAHQICRKIKSEHAIRRIDKKKESECQRPPILIILKIISSIRRHTNVLFELNSEFQLHFCQLPIIFTL